jgi:hypothetical protein
MRQRGMSAESIEAALLVENRERCSPPLTDQEVRKIAQSISRYEPGQQRCAVPDAPLRRKLTAVLPDLRIERKPDAAGGVSLPASWECLRAAVGGASRRDIESAYGSPRYRDRQQSALERVETACRYGTHLPAGLHSVTGQTGGGKSAFVVNLAAAAIAARHPVLYVSLELDAHEIAARVVGLLGKVRWSDLAQRRARSDGERQKRDVAIADLLAGPADLFETWIPTRAVDLEALKTDVIALWHEHEQRTPLVIVDYLQLAGIAAGGHEPLRERIGRIMSSLRWLSRHDPEGDQAWVGCPVVVLSSTARSNVAGESSVPGMKGESPDKLRHADLETLKTLPKEAGEIENYVTGAWVLALGEEEDDGTRRLTARLAKSRYSSAGAWIPFLFQGRTGELTEDARRYATIDEEERAEAEERKAAKKSNPEVF